MGILNLIGDVAKAALKQGVKDGLIESSVRIKEDVQNLAEEVLGEYLGDEE